MSSYYISIQSRLNQRVQAKRAADNLKPPSLMNPGSEKAFADARNALKKEYLDGLMLESHDMSVLIIALNQIGIDHPGLDIPAYVTRAWESKRMDPALEQALQEKEYEQAEARAKASKSDKKQGELEGQLKLKLNDDGSEAEGGDVTVKKMPVTMEELADQIEAMQTELAMPQDDLNTRFTAAGFDNTKSEDEQLAAYQTVWIELNNIQIEANAQLAAMVEATEPAAEAAPVESETEVFTVFNTSVLIETTRTARSLVSDDLLMQIADLVAQDLAGDAETILHHHYANVCGIEDNALISEYVALVIASSDELPAEPTPEDGEETLTELIAANLKRAEELNISMDDLDQLYKDAAYDQEGTLEECRTAAETVQRRLAAMKPVKKRGASKKNTKKAAAEAAEVEEPATADLIG